MTDTTRLRKWVETGLAESDHPPLEQVVRDARLVSTPWKMLADQITEMSGETVNHQTLVNWFPELNKPGYQLAAELETAPPAA